MAAFSFRCFSTLPFLFSVLPYSAERGRESERRRVLQIKAEKEENQTFFSL